MLARNNHAAGLDDMSTPREEKQQITSAGKEYLDRTVKILTPTFHDDPVYNWLLHDLPAPKRKEMLPRLFSGFFTQGSLNGGVFIEVDDFGCCGLFMPPGTSIENPLTILSAGLFSAVWILGMGFFKRALFEYSTGVEPMMKNHLSILEQKNHWYIFIVGTDIDRRRRGHAAKLLIHLQGLARADNCPIWLEATTDASRKLYLKHGFEHVGDLNLGKGKVGADGLPKPDGEGITMCSMLWRP